MIVLASASPRRRALLEGAGIRLVVRPANTDESGQPGEAARAYALRVAIAKAHAVDCIVDGQDVPILAADTTVAIGARVLGKPGAASVATEMLHSLSGKRHHVYTAVVVLYRGRVSSKVVATAVTFRTLTNDEVDRYVATAEPLDRAGAYAIQGGAGAFVHRIRGSYTGVVGLPLGESLSLLAKVGVVP